MKDLLKKYFGYDEFRPLQLAIINRVLDGKDCLTLMPTGGGKSLCYQLPSLKLPGITIVVSPLISLMKDQVDQLTANGISAAFINSTLSASSISNIQANARDGKLKILYIAPERLKADGFETFLKQLNVTLLAIDEAHCISEWGHDFRPDYRNLRNLRSLFPTVPIIALTATATSQVQSDIIKQLKLSDPQVFIASFNRPNLSYSVLPKADFEENLFTLLEKYKNQSAILYCFSRNDTEKIASILRRRGYSALAYHAGLDNQTRQEAQDKFIKDKVNIITATIAFGMGIDKPDVRLVVHCDLPKSIEGYYQETGRGGRDGEAAECVLFFSYGDKRKHAFFINQISDIQEQALAWKKLEEVIQYADLPTCRRRFLLNYFGEVQEQSNCGNCDVCTGVTDLYDATRITQKILSAILRTEESFGAKYIAQVLTGVQDERIRRFAHDSLSVFGIVKDLTIEEVVGVIRQLIAKGLILDTGGQYPVLKVSDAGKILLKERSVIHLPKSKTAKRKIRRDGDDTAQKTDDELFEKLRVLRKTIAEELNVPPYVVFGDTTLKQMASFFPQTSESLLEISGVGKQKLEKFGERFLKAISHHAKKNNLKEIPHSNPKQQAQPKAFGETLYNTLELINQKLTIEEIAAKRSLSINTILQHIETLHEQDNTLPIEYLKPDAYRLEKISIAFDKTGGWMLKPVRDILGEEYSYEELRVARMFIKLAE